MRNQIRYFDVITEKWDDVRAGMFKDEVREVAVRKASLAPHMVVADVGIGAGFIAERVAPLVRKVYGLDVSASMLAAAQRNLDPYGNVELRMIGGNNLSLEDNSVDVVFANMYFHHTLDPLSAIRETVRVLKPAGQLIVIDLDEHNLDWARHEMNDVWLGFRREQVSDWFAKVGLVNIDISDIVRECCVKSSHNEDAYVSVFIASATKPHSYLKDEVVRQYTALASETSIRSLSSSVYQDMPEALSIPVEAVEMSLGCGNPMMAANLRGEETVLDIGCGAGPDVLLAAAKVGPMGRVIGIDLTAAMLERLDRVARDAGFSNVLLVNSDAETIPLPDEAVDVILSNCSINLAVDKGKVFHEMNRVLRPGGRLCVADVVTDKPLPRCVKSNPAEWARCFAGALIEDEYLRLLNQAGFSDISSTRGEVLELYGEISLYPLTVRGSKA